MKQIQRLGLACLVGGLMWFSSGMLGAAGITALDTETGGAGGDLFFALTNLCLAGGVLGLLTLRASGTGWRGRIGTSGAGLVVLALCSYSGGALYSITIGQRESAFVLATRAVGALLVGLGMLVLGLTVLTARRLHGWRRWTPLLVALYYAVMLPFQIVFFISRGQRPSIALLGIWGLTWVLLGYGLYRPCLRLPNVG